PTLKLRRLHGRIPDFDPRAVCLSNAWVGICFIPTDRASFQGPPAGEELPYGGAPVFPSLSRDALVPLAHRRHVASTFEPFINRALLRTMTLVLVHGTYNQRAVEPFRTA